MIRKSRLFYLLAICFFISSQSFSQHVNDLATDTTKPKEVFVSILLLDITKIDDVNKRMTVDFAVRMTWKDKDLDGLNTQILLEDDYTFWHPELQFFNNIDLEPKLKDIVVVNDGEAVYAQRYSGDVSINANFTKFPLDDHEFEIKVAAVNLDSFTFVNNQQLVPPKYEFTLTEWKVDDFSLKIEPFRAQTRYLPGFEYKMHFKRKVQFYVWKTIIPLLLVIFMSWTVFWVHPKHLEAQIAITVTSLLTFVTFQFLLSNILPPLSYLTKMDIFIFGANLIVFFSLIETVVSSYFHDRENLELAFKIDRLSRYVFPVLLIVVLLSAYFW